MRSPRRPVRSAPLLLATLACGCSSANEPPPVEERLADLEMAVSRLGQRLDALAAGRAAPAPADAAPVDTAVAANDVPGRLAALESQVAALEEQTRPSKSTVPIAEPPVEGRPAPRRLTPPRTGPGGASGPTVVEGAPPGAGRAPPAAGTPLEVFAASAGDTVLVRGPGGLDKVRLAGVETRGSQLLRAVGERGLSADALAEASRGHLEELLKGGRATIGYPPNGPSRRGDALLARLEVQADPAPEPATAGAPSAPIDVAQAMVRDGYALAGEGDAERREALEALEAEAKKERRGLFAR